MKQPIYVKDLRPQYAPEGVRFNERLYLVVRRYNPRMGLKPGQPTPLILKAYRGKNGDIYIGTLSADKEPRFHGVKMSDVLRARDYYPSRVYPNNEFKWTTESGLSRTTPAKLFLKEIKNFWREYLEFGICAMKFRHTEFGYLWTKVRVKKHNYCVCRSCGKVLREVQVKQMRYTSHFETASDADAIIARRLAKKNEAQASLSKP